MVDGKTAYRAVDISKSASQDDKAVVPGGKLLDLGINFATYEPMFLAWGIPVFAIAAAVSFIDPSIAAWIKI
jgi:hypothetical protein